MKNVNGIQINEFANSTNELPEYYGWKYYDNTKGKYIKYAGQFIAKRYNDIINIIIEVKGSVYIHPDSIHVTYLTGNFIIKRDLLTDNFLIPQLKNL